MGKKSPKKPANLDTMPEITEKDFLVVGIGASAGGIKALKEFFSNVPEDSGNAYVVILHLSPEHESHLAEVLQTSAVIPVERVTDEKIKVKPNHVYVIPPNRSLAMLDGHLTTTEVITHDERRAPVDIFFRTLAESQETHAVSVILSGTGPNGSMGIKRVKEKGGIILVQDPAEAEYADMPRNSIATGLVDYILPAVDIPAKINEYKTQLGKTQISVEIEKSADERDEIALRDIFTHLRVRTKHDFTNYKRATILRRIERRMNVNGTKDLTSYAQFLRVTSAESQALLKDLLISVTNFFRDREAFEKIEIDVIPKILETKDSKETIRVWVAGCATGEEAYSIAMLLAEACEHNPNGSNVQIFATDIDETAIAQARSGLYSNSDVADVSPERLNKFFTQEGDNYRVRREIREKILFAIHNVTKDPPFSRVDLVTCRNLLIYLNRIAQKRVFETAHFALLPGRFLFLGNSESAEEASDLFVAFDKENRIYQSRPVAARISVPTTSVSPKFFSNVQTATLAQRRIEEIRALERLSYKALHQQLLEQYAPPSIVINEEYDVLHISESAGQFMQISGGEPSTNLLHIARPELRLELRNSLYQAVQKHLPVIVPNVQVRIEEKVTTINIIVRPVFDANDAKRGYILVIFEPSDEAVETKTEIVRNLEPVAHQLEEELTRTKSQLRATIEQYEIQHEELKASNEELQAINEELRSATEELETSKEELQSVNEELQTVNQELKIKIEELSQSNNDFQNLLNSTEVGTIFLDRSLRIKLFTKSVTEMINLQSSDLNRPLSDITHRFKYPGLIDDGMKVFQNLHALEREVKTVNDKWFLMRLFPYRTGEDRIDGLVITFLDITNRKQMEEELRESLARTSEILESISDAFYAVDENFNFTYVNRKAEELWKRKRETIIGKNYWTEFPQARGSESFNRHYQALEQKQTIHYETVSPIIGKWVEESIYPNVNGGLSCYFRQISERKQSEEQLQKSEEQLRLILESASDFAILTQDKNGIIMRWSKGAENLFGYTAAEAVGQNVAVIFTAEDRAAGAHLQEMQTAQTNGRAEDERWHVRKDGSRFYASGVLTPLRGTRNEGFVKIARDQTDKIKAKTAILEKEMLTQLITTQEEERRRIARDIHDHLGQQLTALRLRLDNLKKMCGQGEICDEIDEVQKNVAAIDNDVDFIAWELRPAALDDLGLRLTLENFLREWSRHSNVKTEFHTSGLNKLRLGFETGTNLYRIAQEALNNIYKHANAKHVSVLLEKRKDKVVLIVEDNGVGFDPTDPKVRKKGIGLLGMRERAKILGGEIEIESEKRAGTTVLVRVPLVIETEKE